MSGFQTELTREAKRRVSARLGGVVLVVIQLLNNLFCLVISDADGIATVRCSLEASPSPAITEFIVRALSFAISGSSTRSHIAS
jgi:hypothetical protein